jgi:hypothetical protein
MLWSVRRYSHVICTNTCLVSASNQSLVIQESHPDASFCKRSDTLCHRLEGTTTRVAGMYVHVHVSYLAWCGRICVFICTCVECTNVWVDRRWKNASLACEQLKDRKTSMRSLSAAMVTHAFQLHLCSRTLQRKLAMAEKAAHRTCAGLLHVTRCMHMCN